MFKPNRRKCLQGAFGSLAAAAMPSILSAQSVEPVKSAESVKSSTRRENPADAFTTCLIWGNKNPKLVTLSKQIGVTHAIAGTAGALSRVPRSQYLDTVAKMKAAYEKDGLTIAGVESHPVPADKIKLGIPGRDEEIENYIAAIEALGKVGIPVVCYDFMAGTDWAGGPLKPP